MRQREVLLFSGLMCTASLLAAQVPVSKEPLHKTALENQYIRLLNVWLQPGDTSLFHIHSTPSVFLYLSDANIASQVKGGNWVNDRSETGKTWYRSFMGDALVHRVGNADSVPLHVTDVEILASYKPAVARKPLPFTVLYENEKVIAYRLQGQAIKTGVFKGRGPILAELAAGNEITCHDPLHKKSMKIRTGKFLYLQPGSYFYFTGNENVNLVLFEIK